MKIVYLVDYDLHQSSGVIQKIKQQASQWSKDGNIVYFVSTKTLTVYNINLDVIFEKKALNIGFGRLGTAVKLLYNSFFIRELLSRVEYDIVYMRYRLYIPFFNKLLKENKVVMEVNSDDSVEYKLHSNLTHYYNLWTRKQTLKYIDGFVSVSEELKERFLYLDKQIAVIANGIKVDEYKIIHNNNTKPKFVFIGTPNQSWHGMDKIVAMATYFSEYQFYIIGTKSVDTANIKYFGYLSQAESSKVIETCDIGIGTLSLYEKGLTEASPLKTRQYLACGLAIIYAYKDTDLFEDLDFGLRLDNNKDNMDYKRIEKFVNLVFKNKNIKEQAKSFAKEKLDYSKKEELRLNFLKKVVDEK